MKRTTITTLGIAALLVAGALSSGCSSASTGTTGNGGSGGSATGNGGSTGNGGTTGNGGSSGNPDAGPLAACASTLKDKDPCTTGTDVDCAKTCGISMSGATKPCTCVATTGLWSCTTIGSCVYPSTYNHTCYVRPATPPACPALTQSNTTACTPTANCADSICSGYYDSNGVAKTGWCSCTGMKVVDGGAPMPVYLCASSTEWPPQQ